MLPTRRSLRRRSQRGQEPVQEDTPGELEENGEKVEKIWLLREE